VDISKEAIGQLKEHMQLNGIEPERHSEYCEDAFDFLRREPLDYGIVILDPPAFAKRKSDVERAVRGYQEINRTALSKMPKGSLLLTCSCSYHVDEPLFRKMLFHAAKESGRDLKLLQSHRTAFDHPVSIFHPEGSYLKSFLCYVV
jgi:23S rRNA (cytosine1962-C5)-methyltransferase